MQRDDDYQQRRASVAHLSDSELESRFWQLIEQIVTPMVEMAKIHTSPSIERSVLLRMGFSSMESNQLVEKCVELGLLGKGAGHVVYRVAQQQGISIRQAGEELLAGKHWAEIAQWATGGASR